MSEPTELTPAGRAAGVILGLALAVFFGAMGILILGAPINDPDTTAWGAFMLRAFIALIFGSMTGLGGYGVYAGVRGRPRPPSSVLARCPACGEPRAGERCAHCDRAPGELAREWREVPSEDLGPALLGLGIGGALLSLGLFLASGAAAEPRVLLAIAYAALAFLLAVVGGVMTVGGLVAVRIGIGNLRRRAYALSVRHAGVTIDAEAKLAPGALALSGSATAWTPIDAAPAGEPFEVSPTLAARSLVRTLAVLHARGEASLSYVEKREWAIKAPGDLVRGLEIDVHVDAVPSDSETDADPRDVVLGVLANTSVRSLFQALATHADLRNAFDTYAERLPLDEADPRTLRLLAAVLRAGTLPPYRHPG